MALIKQDRITAEYVLSKVDEVAIFSYYFPHFSLKKAISSPFRRDRNPSCSFYIAKNGEIKFKDFATGESLNCFGFVAKLNNENYGRAISRIACDFNLVECGGRPVERKLIKKAELIAENERKDTDIQVTANRWDKEYLSMWNNLSITQEELEQDGGVVPVDKLYINGKFISNWRNEIRYAYLLPTKNKIYKKIYTPYATERRFKWISNIPLHIPFGITSLPKESNILIIAKSYKERLLFKKWFSDVIAIQAENPSALNEKTRKFIEKHYDTVLTFFDADDAGFKCAEYFNAYNYTPYFIPSSTQEEGWKDWAELVENYDLEAMELHLKQLKLI